MRFRRISPGLVDIAIAAALVVAAEIHVWSGAAGGSKLVTAPAALVIAGALAARRRAPLHAVVIAMLATAMQSALASSPQALWLIATWVILFFSAGRWLERGPALLALGVGLAGAAIDEARAADRSVSGFVFALGALVALPWIAGRAVEVHESRATTLEREGEESTRRALEAERTRIARDLHDVVAHAVSLIVLNAEAADAVLDADASRVRTQLASIQSTGRQALAEMARLLEMLRTEQPGDAVTQPRVAQVPTLVDDVRRAGLDVRLRIDGDARRVEPGVDLTIYRIVQEALTNALKHGRAGGRTEVVLGYAADAVSVEIVSDGGASRTGAGGHGLIGMRERVTLYGGRIEAGATHDDRFIVKVVVPA